MSDPELSGWLDKPDSQTRLKASFESATEVNEENFEIVPSPFKVLRLKNVLSNKVYVDNLLKEVTSLPFERKLNDLYSLWQTEDLQNCDSQVIKTFIDFLEKSIKPIVSKVTGIEFNNKLSTTASCYNSGDHLLCHDDKCEDRSVAFVFYLNDFGDLDAGGEFEMFAHGDDGQPTDVTNSLDPLTNSFICFEVGNYTYHQVAEVKGEDLKRYSINGWFHSEKALEIKPLPYTQPLPSLLLQTPLSGLFLLDEYIFAKYCTPSSIQDFRDHVTEESFLMLSNFLCPKFYKQCFKSLKDKSIKWNMVGPANRRKYEIADVESLSDESDTLMSLMRSPLFIHYLRNLTGLSIAPLSHCDPGSKLTLELQRWKPGYYTMATDNDEYFQKPGLDVYIFLISENICWGTPDGSGFITYLSSSEEDEDCELLTLEPTENAFCIVYRAEDTVMFTKYISAFFSGFYYCVRATYYETEDSSSDDT